jgi:penicillin-binding protein 2
MEKHGNEYSALDYLGKSGLEYFWETELRGKNGKKSIEVDALGREKKVVGEQLPIDGYNLKLSLDLPLQQKAEEVTQSWLDKLRLGKASVVIINPQNGEILSLVSLPGYDSNLFAKGISQADYKSFLDNVNHPLLNRAISGEYPSGSVIKPVIALAALEEKVINDKTSFLSNGGLRLGQWFFPDWKAGGHGVTNVYKAIAESVNTFFYYIGGGHQDFQGLGLDRLTKYLRLFGLGEKTGIDVNSEAVGFVPSAQWKEETKGEQWYIGDTYHLAIGQGDLIVTPLQIAASISAIANGGTLYKPHLVSEILDKDNNLVRGISPEILSQIPVSSENVEIIRNAMRQTVTSGSARSLSELPVEVAGKTGTAQWSTKADPHAWFVGFAPFDQPTFLIVVMVEEGEEGSTVSVPIAREIMGWYFHNQADATSTSQ